MKKTLAIEEQGRHSDHFFMQQALEEARIALSAGEFPVGCVLVQDKQIVGRGHRENSRGEAVNEIDHAEVVTLRKLLHDHPGFDCQGITLYCTMEPCLMCYATMLLSGIRRFVWAYEDIMGGGTSLPLTELFPLYQEMSVELVPDVLRRESLDLFARFFQDHSYWQGSLLAKYTLEQWQLERKTSIM